MGSSNSQDRPGRGEAGAEASWHHGSSDLSRSEVLTWSRNIICARADRGHDEAVFIAKSVDDKFTRIDNEIKVLETIGCHPHVLQRYHGGVHSDFSTLALELFNPVGHDLNRLRNAYAFARQTVPSSLMARIHLQLIRGLAHMHSKDVIHRNLKAESVLIDASHNVKLTDLGLACAVGTRDALRLSYLAPEACEGKAPLGVEVDLWGLGLILHQVYQKQWMILADSGPVRMLRGKPSDALPMDKPVRDAMHGLLRFQPADRWTFRQLEESEWLKGSTAPDASTDRKRPPATDSRARRYLRRYVSDMPSPTGLAVHICKKEHEHILGKPISALSLSENLGITLLLISYGNGTVERAPGAETLIRDNSWFYFGVPQNEGEMVKAAATISQILTSPGTGRQPWLPSFRALSRPCLWEVLERGKLVEFTMEFDCFSFPSHIGSDAVVGAASVHPRGTTEGVGGALRLRQADPVWLPGEAAAVEPDDLGLVLREPCADGSTLPTVADEELEALMSAEQFGEQLRTAGERGTTVGRSSSCGPRAAVPQAANGCCTEPAGDRPTPYASEAIGETGASVMASCECSASLMASCEDHDGTDGKWCWFSQEGEPQAQGTADSRAPGASAVARTSANGKALSWQDCHCWSCFPRMAQHGRKPPPAPAPEPVPARRSLRADSDLIKKAYNRARSTSVPSIHVKKPALVGKAGSTGVGSTGAGSADEGPSKTEPELLISKRHSTGQRRLQHLPSFSRRSARSIRSDDSCESIPLPEIREPRNYRGSTKSPSPLNDGDAAMPTVARTRSSVKYRLSVSAHTKAPQQGLLQEAKCIETEEYVVVKERLRRHSNDGQVYLMDLDGEEFQSFRAALKCNCFCVVLGDTEALELARSAELFSSASGEEVVRQGEPGTHFFVVRHGQYALETDAGLSEVLGPGDSFGEVPLVHGCRQRVTVTAKGAGKCWGVRREQFLRVMQAHVERMHRECTDLLESVKLFKYLDKHQKTTLIKTFAIQTYDTGRTVLQEGMGYMNCLFILKSGSLEVTEAGSYLATLSPGDTFGERSLLYHEKRTRTVTALEAAMVCIVPCESLEEAFGKHFMNEMWRNHLVNLSTRDLHLPYNDNLQSFCNALFIADFPPGANIITDTGAGGVRFITVLDGCIEVRGPGDSEGQSISRGNSFGHEYFQDPSRPFQHHVENTSEVPCKLAFLTADAVAVLSAPTTEDVLTYAEKIACLRKSYIFRHLSQHQAKFIVRSFRTIMRKQGEKVIVEGDLGSQFFVIQEGELVVTAGGRSIRTLGKSDYFGERCLLYDTPRTATVTCQSEVARLMVIDRAVFLQIVEGKMLQHLEERIELQSTLVNFDDLRTVRVLGRGSFGVVRLVEHKTRGTEYAMKCISRAEASRNRQQVNLQLEREILLENDHPFIMKVVRTFKDKKMLYFLTELVTGGELFSAIRTIGIMDRQMAQFYVGSLISVFESLHERSIAYRDLKPENILLDSQGFIKLIDFGCAAKLRGVFKTIVGTPHYMAPEVILDKGYRLTCDVWSLGVCVYEFMCGPLPFANNVDDTKQIFYEILTGGLRFPDHLTDGWSKDFMRQLLYRPLESRLGCGEHGWSEVRSHGFFRGFDFDRLLSRQVVPPLVPEPPAKQSQEASASSSPEDSSEDSAFSDVSKDTGSDPDPDDDWDKDF